MTAARALVLIGVLLAPAVLTGCLSSAQGTKDWWLGQGGLVVELSVLPETARGQSIQDFSTLKIAIDSVVAKPVNEVQAHAGVVYRPQLGVDLVTRFTDGPKVVLERTGIEAKAIGEVEMKLIFVEAKDKDGNLIPPCPLDKPAEQKPCFALERTGRYVLDKNHNPPRMVRAQTMTMEFPFAVVFNPQVNEYFLQTRSADEEAPVTFTKD